MSWDPQSSVSLSAVPYHTVRVQYDAVGVYSKIELHSEQTVVETDSQTHPHLYRARGEIRTHFFFPREIY